MAEPMRVFRFGPFEADLGNRQLFKNGVPVSLVGQPFEILALLLERPGQLVTREQLRARLWPSGTVVEFDHSIATAITKLREALGDEAQRPRFIATVPRHGYRFITPISAPTATTLEAPAASSGRVAEPVPAGPVRSPRGLLVWAVIAALTVLAVVVAYVVVERLWIQQHVPASPRVTPAAAVPKTDAMAGVAQQSIAVLPFVDMSEKKDQEYFADGLAEELIDLLAETPGLRVIARTSSFSFRGKPDDVPTIATKLQVANLLEGSVRKSGKRLRVSTQLVRAADGEHLWSETYDRELKDVFKLQDEIALAVVTAMKLKLSPAQGSLPNHSSNTDAYLQYLLGQQYLSRGSANDFHRAVAAYRSAVALDPHYAAGYAGLAQAEAFLSDATGDTAGLERALAAAERAIELAPGRALGYTARGFVRYLFIWDWAGAQGDFARALEFDPNDPTVLHHYSNLLSSLGRMPEATAIARKVVDLDPLSVRAWQYLAVFLVESGDLEAAREASRHALAIDPTNEFALANLGAIELLAHKSADALAVFQKITGAEENQLGFRLTGIAMAEHSLGHAKESKQALDEATAKTAQAMAYQIAEAYAWGGEADEAFRWLERAYRQHDGGLAELKTDPLLQGLHSDPRYEAMLKRLNLPE
jgi:TolB-like protein/DNA-binding winged helix-turn-helix (wHTH) protein/cytochrome c-type biogenesis protein CcmH/NrfG